MTATDSGHSVFEQAVRLIFEYDGDSVRLVSQQPVDVVVTGIDPAPVHPPGIYVDTRDAAGATLTRVAAPGALAESVEVYPEQPGEPIRRVDVTRPSGAFTVVVPAPATASRVAVVRVATGPPAAPGQVGAAAAVTDLATFPLEVNR